VGWRHGSLLAPQKSFDILALYKSDYYYYYYLLAAKCRRWQLLSVTRLTPSSKYAGARLDNNWCTTHAALYSSGRQTFVWRLTTGNSTTDTSETCDTQRPWSFCKTCIAMKFVDDDDDDNHRTHHWLYQGQVFTCQMTQPTVSKHWRKIGPKD